MSADPRRVGIDVGGTKCLGVALDAAGSVVAEHRRATPRSARQLVEVVADIAERLGPASSVGVGVPGLVTSTGVLRAAPNLRGIPSLAVADLLSERLATPVAVDNDATCAVLAEWTAGAAAGASDVVMVTLGTGIGGGAVLGGRLQRGHQGFAGEYGHMVVDPHGPPCVCGRRGCWERYASGSGVARLARDAALGGRAGRVVELAGGDPEAVRGEHVQQAALDGDPDALAVVDEFARWIALGLANLTNALDPEVFVLGGGLATGADLYLEPVRRWVAELLYAPGAREIPRIEFASLGERAGAVGAALLAGVD